MFSSRVTLDSYHSTLILCDNMTVCFLSREQNFSAYTTSLLHPHRNFGYLHGSLTPTQKFQITPQVSYTHIEIWNSFPGLLHPHKNFGFLHGSLTPTQRFRIIPRVSYTHIEISDNSTSLLHQHRNFGIASRVSYTHIKILDFSTGLLHPQRNSR